MKIPDLINELFESREMSEYLIEHSTELSKYNILRMVCSAPIDIRRKAEILLELSKDENIEKEIAEKLNCGSINHSEKKEIIERIKEDSFRFNYECVSKAIEHLHCKPGDVFTMQNIWHDEDGTVTRKKGDFYLSSSFENILTLIKDYMEFEGWSFIDKNAYSWFEITKWSLNKNGDYDAIIVYEFVNNKLMYYFYVEDKKSNFNIFEPNCDLNLTTPFTTGNILTVDCCPYKPERNILILENITNDDCCSLQGLYYDPTIQLFNIGAVKHASMYRGLYRPSVSPLYRISENVNELSNEEAIFKDIKSFLNGDSQKGQEMWSWIYNTKINKEKRKLRNSDGVTAKELRKYMEEQNCEQ